MQDKLLDDIGRQILRALQENARVSFSDLGRIVSLSSPAVAERVKRLEQAGYIKGYSAVVDREKLGYPITAFVRLNVGVGMIKDADDAIRSIPEVVEAHRLTGRDAFLVKLGVSNVAHLEGIVDMLAEYGQTTSSIVLSTPVDDKVLRPASDV